MLTTQNIAIIGAGTMGRTIATGIVNAQLLDASQLYISDREPLVATKLAKDLGANSTQRNTEACRNAEIVLLCVKPHDISQVIHELRDATALWPRAVIISIAAGVTTGMIEQWTNHSAAVVRAMPNTASRVGKGMTVLSRGAHVSDEHLAVAQTIFSTLGRCIVLDEKHMNVVTSLAGSGPAFVYMRMEALVDGGVMCGLPRQFANEIVAQVAAGAAEMVLSSGLHTSTLKDEVTTPGGCTIAGLLALEDGNIRSVLARAVERTAQVASGLAA